MIKYFADVNGTTYESTKADYINGANRAPRIWTGSEWVFATRKVTYKSNPILHECDDRCLHAKGKNMNCECKCGGKNHGKGA